MHTAWSHWGRGSALAELGRHEDALAAFDAAIEAAQTDAGAAEMRGTTAKAYVGQARSLWALDRMDDAKAACMRVLQSFSDSAAAPDDPPAVIGAVEWAREALDQLA